MQTTPLHHCSLTITSGRTLQVAASSQNPGKQVSAAALAALLSFSSVAGPLLVMPDAAHAARSGGRAGGSRSFSSRPAPARAPAARAPAARVNTNTNYAGGGGSVRYVPSPVMGFGFSPFGYSPFGGMGTGYALGSMASSGQRYETNRLENEVSVTYQCKLVKVLFVTCSGLGVNTS